MDRARSQGGLAAGPAGGRERSGPSPAPQALGRAAGEIGWSIVWRMLTFWHWEMLFSISPGRPTHNDGSPGASKSLAQIVCDRNPPLRSIPVTSWRLSLRHPLLEPRFDRIPRKIPNLPPASNRRMVIDEVCVSRRHESAGGRPSHRGRSVSTGWRRWWWHAEDARWPR